MKSSLILDAYLDWLLEIVSSDSFPFRDNYHKLGEYLLHKMFYWTVRNDENRAMDGLNLRREYFENGQYPDGEVPFDFIMGGCSVLEMMVALAIRAEQDVMASKGYEDRTAEWFWIMIEGLELQNMTDSEIDFEYCEWTTNRFLRREYDENGLHGGLFHALERVHKFSKAEIWYQMEWFFEENYDVFVQNF